MSQESLADAIKTFRSIPLVKTIAKTKEDNLEELVSSSTEEDIISLHQSLSTFLRNPLVAKVAKAEGRFISYICRPDGWYSRKGEKVYELKEWPALSMFREVKNLVNAGNRASKGKISAEIKRDIVKWVNGDIGRSYLDTYAIDKIMAVPGIRPDHPVVLFRGLLFQKWQFEQRADGNRKSAKPIIDALMMGKEYITYQETNPVSWTTSKKIADNFASQRSAGSQYSAMMQWLHTKGRIDGKLGIILAILARPDQVAVDLSKIDLGYTVHGDEGEMILLPGKRVAKVVSILTPDGEISIHEFPEYIKNLLTQ